MLLLLLVIMMLFLLLLLLLTPTCRRCWNAIWNVHFGTMWVNFCGMRPFCGIRPGVPKYL